MAKEVVLKKVKGVPYEIVGEEVVLHKPEGDVALPLVLGQSAYSVAFGYLTRKGPGQREKSGSHVVGNFMWSLGEAGEDEKVELTITRKDGSILTSTMLTSTQARYPRTQALSLIAGTLE